MSGDRPAAKRWLEELKAASTTMRTTDYRTTEYDDAVDAVLRLCKPEYVQNALAALDVLDSGATE